MSLTSILPSLPAIYTIQKNSQKHEVLETTSNAEDSTFSKKSKAKHHGQAEKLKAVAEAKAAKEREEQCVRLYELWSKIKEDKKEEHYQYLKERVTLQHEIIKRQDKLFEIHRTKIEQRQLQLREAKRLSRMAKSRKYSDFVQDILAQDRNKSVGLKSHFRIISSHEPKRALKPVADKRCSLDSSKAQSPRQPSMDSTGRTGVDSSLLTDNFKELLLDPVEVQLQKLLGPDEAEDFLHPTFREGAKKTLNPMTIQRKLSGIGASELWSVLRNKSQMKLEKQDDVIPVDVKKAYTAFLRECLQNNVPTVRRSFCKEGDDVFEEDRISESQLIQDVKLTRHRLDLMFRVAHMNRDKTKLLVKTTDSGDPPEGTVCRPPRYNPHQILEKPKKQQLSSVPTLALTDTEGEHKSIPLPPSPREETSELVTQRDDMVTAEKITFLTEEMATCEGEFSKRHNAPGCSSSLALVKKGPSRGNRTRGSLSAPASSMSTREEKKSQVKHWEPLSVNALLEYNLDSLRAPGSGEFLFGKSKTWKIQ